MSEHATCAPTEAPEGTMDGPLTCLSSSSDKDPALGSSLAAAAAPTNEEIVMDGDRRTITTEEWTTRWENEQIAFHKVDRHPKLVRYIDTLINGREEVKIFFPLCGKTTDMKWMYDEGYTVVGVEASPKAVEEFFLDHDLTYIADSVPAMDGALYKTEDNRLRIYCGDLFKFSASIEKEVTATFDRGSLVAINKADRRRYVDLLSSLMAPDARCLLITYDYDPSIYPGPPHYLSLDELAELYDSKWKLDLLSVEDASPEDHLKKRWGLEILLERVHLLTLKQ